ncbi:MAG: T9SS type A sorting domain-containing protein [Ignavibacteriaceae bacterium]|nr:T9SS type A sorting domain-containing protein [Ignavibacteriaceae bacterium]
MKRLILLSLINFYTIYPQYIPTYVESSSGLNDPFLDGGRTEVELADVNGDGNLDIISVGDHGSPNINTVEHGIMVWFGDGSGSSWSVFQYGNFGYGGVAVGDVNNDGDLDVGYGIHHNYSGEDLGDQILEVALGNGTGKYWSAWDNGLATNGEDWGMFCTDFADLDCDGDLDLGANSFGCCAGVHIYLNNGDGTWTQSFGFVGGNSTMDFVFGDVNNDGFPDIAVAQQNGTVYMNDGTANFSLADGNLPGGGNIGREGPDLGDIDNDGTDELSIINSSGGIEMWKWSAGNVWTSVSNGLPSSGSYESTQVNDMNMDGLADVAAFGNGMVTVWLGDGTGNWNQAAQFTLPSPGYFQAFRIEGDADHNGYSDIALVSDEGSWPSDRNHLRFFKENSPADSLTIRSVFPSPERKVNVLSVQTLKWISEVPAGDSSWVKLEVSINDTVGPWHLIASGLPNNGHYQWSVPENMASFEKCRVRYTVYTLTDSISAITLEGFYIIGDPMSINQESGTLPSEFILYQNYPNPFNPNTKIKFSLTPSLSLRERVSEGRVRATLKVYDVLGNEIALLLNKELPAGEYEIEFSPESSIKRPASGIYFYQLKAGSFIQTKKMILLK